MRSTSCAARTRRWLGRGAFSVAKALCASSSYPPFFKPVEIDGRLLVDGAFSNAVPADLARQMGAQFVVGIDLSAFKKEKKSKFY